MSSASQFGGSGGSSLEHCFTNIFALTDFSGIQYRKYVLKSDKEFKNALEDPLIKSYARCLKQGVLCAWVRSKRDSSEVQDPCAFSKFAKELWVFWYGNGDFANAEECILPELREEDSGNWRQGLSYETRTVLFRALHNVVERCLLTKGFVRLGKWFMQPYKPNCNYDYPQYSVKFSFFLHGESTVCASLDLRQLPWVQKISVNHVEYCSENQKTLPVILAPFGVSAELAGFVSAEKEEELKEELETWSWLYPIKSIAERDPGVCDTIGLPSLVMTAAVQGPRSSNAHKFASNPDRLPTVTSSSQKTADLAPSFVEVIVGAYRMHYPFCFVLLPEANKKQTGSAEQPPKTAVSSEVTQSSAPTLQHTVSGGMFAPPSVKDSKTSSAWRIPRKRKATRNQAACLTINQAELLRISKLFQSDLPFTVRRFFLAERTLQRICEDDFLPCPVDYKRNKSAWSETEHRYAEAWYDSSPDDIHSYSSDGLCLWSSLGPRAKFQCHCHGLGFPHQLACCGPFHHNDVNVKQIRTTSLTAVDCRDHPKSPSTFTTAFLLAHDPSMPTLSPQQPASASGSLMPSVSWARQESSSGDSTLRSDQLMCNNSVVPASVPPSLPAVSTPTTKLDSSVDGSFVNSCVGLPVGLVTVGQSPSTIHNSQYARMPSCFSPPLSITKRPPYNAWLIDRANQECSSALEPASKPPHLNLEVADECEREQAHSHKNDVVQYLISKQNLPVSSALDNCCLSGDETTAFYYKRIHLTCNGYSKDDPRCHSDEPIDQSGLLTSVGPDNLSPDVLFEAVGSEPLDDDLNSPTSGTELLQGISPTVTSCSNKNNVFGRSVGGLLHKGVSLASSTGSGHVGPAELALMLPTPPSHDAPQPSPVDIILPTGARPSACSTTTDSPTSVNHTSMEPLTLTADSGLLSSPMHHQPLSPLPTHHAQGLLQLAKQSCIFSSSLFSPHDVVQDWSFVCPCAAYLGMASEYQMACNDLTAFTKSLPQVSLAYDHRAVYSKPSLASGFNEVTDGAGATQYQYMPSPTKETCLKNQQKSWLLSPNCQSNSKSALAQNSQLEACLLDGDLHHPASNTLNTGGTNMSLLKSSVSGHLITPAQSRSEELSDRLVGLLKADGVLMNLMLSDSMLNLFKDHNFDSCNICECTSSVLGAEIDIYLSNPVVAPTSTVFKTPRANLGGSVGGFGTHDLVGGSGFVFSHGCKCGFSAVMNQRCAVNGNLFYEDEMEVTNLSLRLDRDLTRPTYSVIPMYRQPSGWWCGSSSASSAHLVILQQVLGSPYDEFSVRQLTEYLRRMNLPSFFSSIKENMLEYDDSCALVAAALFESAKASDSDGSTDERLIERPLDQRVIMHPAYILKAQWRIPENHNDQIRLLTTIRPWLQEAISSTRLLESNYTVDGPLTWRAFHQLAGRGPDETCKPQPIPQLRVAGSDKEHLLISPFAVRDWDRLSLVPLSRPKQIAYVVVVPWDSDECQADLSSLISNNVTESETTSARMSSRETGTRASVNARNHSFIQHSLARFFRELSHTYENCRLGQHSPYFQPELNCPETAFVSVRPCAEQSLDNCSLSPELFRSLMNQLQNRCHHPAVFLTRLQAYVSAASYCTVTSLRDHGVTVNTTAGTCSSHSRSITKLFPPFGSSASNNEKNDSKIKIRSQNMNPSKERGNSSTSPSNGEGPLTTSLDTSLWGTSNDTYVVIYLINPFSQLCDISSELHRLVMQAFIGCADKILTSLPDLWRPRVTIQFLSLDQIMCDYLPRLRSIALAVYSSVNRYIEPTLINANRTLTGIGPSAEKEVISLEKEGYHRRSIRAPAYTLIGPQDFVCQADTSPPDPLDRSSVLFVAYCLSQDQQWLLASFTDEQGGVLDQTLINIRVPSSFFTNLENHRPHTSSERTIVSPRRIGLARLWDYIINFLSRTSNPWRLVIGRVGRLGHGELKGWNGLLGRKSLQDVNRFLRERCLTCNASATTPASLTNVPSLNGGAKTTLNLINTSAGANSCTHELPSLISACLVSLEPQSTFRIYPGVRLCSDDAWACGGGGGAGGGGGPGSGSGGNLGGGSCGGAGSSSWGSSASPFMMRTMTLLGSAIAPNDVPSTTHILVFPTSTSASGLSEHDASALNEVISGISQEDMNVLEWLRSGNNELAELDAPDGATAAILGDLDNPTGLGFDLPGLGGGVGGIGVNDHVGLDDPHDNILSHSDYGAGLRDPRAHDRISDSTGLHGLGSSAVDLGTGLNSAGGGSQGLHFDEQAAAAGSEYLNTMPFGIHDRTDEVTNLMQQPLAMGYYISTAPTGPLPSWFWSSCPHSSLQYPVCLKSALHLQTSLVGVDDAAAAAVGAPPSATTPGSGGPGVAASEKPSHLLDSTSTCDVLRYVLEAYNALSWLTINPVTNDRRSCLPIHMLILCQLYHGLEAYT